MYRWRRAAQLIQKTLQQCAYKKKDDSEILSQVCTSSEDSYENILIQSSLHLDFSSGPSQATTNSLCADTLFMIYFFQAQLSSNIEKENKKR